MKYLHAEVYFGSGLSDKDHSDYFVCAVPESVYNNEDSLKSTILVNYIKNNKFINQNDVRVIEQSNSEIWFFDNQILKPLHAQKTLNQSPSFFFAEELHTFITIGALQEIPLEPYEALKGLFVNFSIDEQNYLLINQ